MQFVCERDEMCVRVRMFRCLRVSVCVCAHVPVGLLLSHGLYSLRLWITAFSRLLRWTGLCQLAVYCYTIQLGERGLELRLPPVTHERVFSKKLCSFPLWQHLHLNVPLVPYLLLFNLQSNASPIFHHCCQNADAHTRECY